METLKKIQIKLSKISEKLAMIKFTHEVIDHENIEKKYESIKKSN